MNAATLRLLEDQRKIIGHANAVLWQAFTLERNHEAERRINSARRHLSAASEYLREIVGPEVSVSVSHEVSEPDRPKSRRGDGQEGDGAADVATYAGTPGRVPSDVAVAEVRAGLAEATLRGAVISPAPSYEEIMSFASEQSLEGSLHILLAEFCAEILSDDPAVQGRAARAFEHWRQGQQTKAGN
jgi:hypothetical protein